LFHVPGCTYMAILHPGHVLTTGGWGFDVSAGVYTDVAE
jgi:hypothetical protein